MWEERGCKEGGMGEGRSEAENRRRREECKIRSNNPPELGIYRPHSSVWVNEKVLPLSPRSCHEPKIKLATFSSRAEQKRV